MLADGNAQMPINCSYSATRKKQKSPNHMLGLFAFQRWHRHESKEESIVSHERKKSPDTNG